MNLQSIALFQRVNPIPPLGIPIFRKDEILKYRYTLEAWRSEVESTKDALERAEELTKGVWNDCSYAMEEWGIGEFKETL